MSRPRADHRNVTYEGNLMRRTRSWKRGSERSGSRGGSTLRKIDPLIADFVGPLEPFERLVLLAEPCMDECHFIRPDAIFIHSLSYLSKALSSLSHPSRSRIQVPQVTVATLIGRDLSDLGHGFLVHPFLPVDHRTEVPGACGVSVESPPSPVRAPGPTGGRGSTR